MLRDIAKDNPDMGIMDILRATLRNRNYTNPVGDRFNLEATDEEFSVAIELTLKELNEPIDYE